MSSDLTRPIISRFEIDLSEAHAAPGLEIPVYAPILYVVQVDFPARIRVDNPRAEPIPLLTGEYRAPNDKIIERIYIENEAGSAGQIAVLIPATNLTITARGSISNQGATRSEIAPTPGSLTDRSGSTLAASKQIAAANPARKYFFIQNTSASDIWLNFGDDASDAGGSILIKANGSFVMEGSYISTQSVNVFASGAGLSYTAKEG